MHRRAALAVAFIALTSGPRAFADDEAPHNAETRPTAVYVTGGLGTPLGLVGLEVERTIARFFEVSAGVGVGYASLDGPDKGNLALQVGFMPRLLIPLGRRRIDLAIGAGVSYGRYQSWDSCGADCLPTSWAGNVLWGNGEVAIEYRGDDGLYWRAFGGPAHVLAGTLTCTESVGCAPGSEEQARTVPYGGAAIGWSF
jgi:hypothetical protein